MKKEKEFEVIEESVIKELWSFTVEAKSEKEAIRKAENYDYEDFEELDREVVSRKFVKVQELANHRAGLDRKICLKHKQTFLSDSCPICGNEEDFLADLEADHLREQEEAGQDDDQIAWQIMNGACE
jgi:hypothetical protein